MDAPTPLGAMGLLSLSRSGAARLTPTQALREQQAGAILVDLRTEAHRRASQEVPGALVIDLTVLPWRLDPSFGHRIPEATSWKTRYVLMCRHGYSSSVAAAVLRHMGLVNVTDIEGGYEAWEAQGLPTTDEPADVRS